MITGNIHRVINNDAYQPEVELNKKLNRYSSKLIVISLIYHWLKDEFNDFHSDKPITIW